MINGQQRAWCSVRRETVTGTDAPSSFATDILPEQFRVYKRGFQKEVLGTDIRYRVFETLRSIGPVFKKTALSDELGWSFDRLTGVDVFTVFRKYGLLYDIPKVHRPGESYAIRIDPIVEWVEAPVRPPDDPFARRIVTYLCAGDDPPDDSQQEDVFQANRDPLHAIVYATASDHAHITDPAVQLDVIPTDGSENGWPSLRGVQVTGHLTGKSVSVSNRRGLRLGLESLMWQLIQHTFLDQDLTTIQTIDSLLTYDVTITPPKAESTSDRSGTESIEFEGELAPRVKRK
jgi:hypothetical protein